MSSNLTPEDLKKLAEPFDDKTICIKVQSLSKDHTKAMLVPYIQHTDYYSRIESVDPAWTNEVTSEVAHDKYVNVRMKMTIKGVTRENYGEGDEFKSAASDALKRTGMLFGIGRFLYDADQVWVPYNEQTDKYKTFTYADYAKALKSGQRGVLMPGDSERPGIVAEIEAAAKKQGIGLVALNALCIQVTKKAANLTTIEELKDFLEYIKQMKPEPTNFGAVR